MIYCYLPAVFDFCPLEMLPEEQEGGGPLADGQEHLQLESDDQENDEGSLVPVAFSHQTDPARLQVLPVEQADQNVLILFDSLGG